MKSKSILLAALAATTALWAMSATARGEKSGGKIFATNPGNGTIGEYTTSGETVNASLLSLGVNNNPRGIAVSGANLFVTNTSNGTIGEYTTSGATVNASLVSGLSNPFLIAVVPEPSTFALGILGVLSHIAFGRRYRWRLRATRAM
jgi:pectin methylesterase-like acyl-CoA thioesterase